MTKNKKYKRKKELFTKSVNINNLLKKPIKGGTPAIENRSIVKTSKWKLLKWKLLNECNVLNFVKIAVNSVQNNRIKEVLYKNI